MLTGTYPGVYLREEESAVRTIVGVPTSIAAFVGPTKSGIDGRARRILNFADFERAFGGLASSSELSYGVLHFFQNGGGEAVVVRVANGASKKAGLAAQNAVPEHALVVQALSSGTAGSKLYFEVERAPGNDVKTFNLAIVDANTGVRELFSDLSTEPAHLRYAPAIVNDPDLGSQLVSIGVKAKAQAPVPTGMTFTAKPPPNNAFGTKSAGTYKFKASIKRIEGGLKETLAEVELPLFQVGDTLPASHAQLGRKIEEAINAALSSRNLKPRVESTLLEFRDANNVVMSRQLRFRLKSADPINDETPDAVIAVMEGSPPPELPPPALPVLALFGLEGATASANASRYRLGFDYAADPRVKAAAPVVGEDKGLPGAEDLKAGLKALDKAPFNLLCLPDLVRAKEDDAEAAFYATYQDVYATAAQLCESRRAFLLLDPPPHVNSVDKAEAWKTSELIVRSPHGAAYFPRLRMSDPLNPGVLRAYAPSGTIAGIMARTDASRGVWKSPAGVDAGCAGVYAPAVVMSDEEHGLLNPLGINCVRKFPIFGSVSFGARTLVGSDAEADQWKYIAVRRTASYILLSLQRGLTWVTYRGNDEPLWGAIRMNVATFMQGLFRQGAFQGRSPREAYLVKCDSETTRQADIDQGIVNIVVGFAPLKPAEFVFVTLRQLAGQAQT